MQTKVFTRHCPEHLYKNAILENSVGSMYKILTDILHLYDVNTRESVGNTLSTILFAQSKEHILNLPGFEKLRHWLEINLLELIDDIGWPPNAKGIEFKRAWSNLMYKGSEGISHTHESYSSPTTAGVAIFYFKAPKNSSKFVIVDSKEIDKKIDYYDSNLCKYIDVEEGMLLVHDASIVHGVSKHNNDEPRICFIFDFYYKY
jgi:hypothetical protein